MVRAPTAIKVKMLPSDDMMHPITHVGHVPLATPNGHQNKLGDVLYVPNITKNLASAGQMCDQDMQVCFNKYGYFIEEFIGGRVG